MSAPTPAAMPPLFRLTGGADFPQHVKALLTGPPKSGKTSFLGTVPNIVIADTEPDANNLQSIAHKNLPYVTVNGSGDLQRLLFVLKDEGLRKQAAEQMGMPAIEAVAIDTMDTLQAIFKRERMHEQRTTKFQRDDWQWLKDEMIGIISAFTKLPLHVIFTVHVKTQNIGSEEDQSTIFLPSLQGSIDQEIAGLVGYSFLSFRREELRPDGSPYTRYLLRAEGNDTYSFLGNRIGNVKLPDIIEPNFQVLVDAIAAGRAATATVAQPVAPNAQQPAAQPAQQAPAAPEVAQSPGQPAQPESAVQTPVQSSAPAQQAPAAAPAAPPAATQQAAPNGQPTDAKPGDDEPVNPTAMGYAKKVYDACQLAFPEELIKGLNLGKVRQLVKMFQAIQSDAADGKLERSPIEEMTAYLEGMGWLGGPAPAPPAPPVADVTGTIDQVMAYVGDDLAKAQEAYDLEIAKPKPRVSLINTLTAIGVKVQTGVQNEAPTAPAPAAEAPAPTPAPAEQSAPPAAPAPAETPAPAVTPEAAPAENSQQQENEALALVQSELGAKPIDEAGAVKGCEECGGPIDDEDIATLSQSRFGRRLDVEHYIAETKKSH